MFSSLLCILGFIIISQCEEQSDSTRNLSSYEDVVQQLMQGQKYLPSTENFDYFDPYNDEIKKKLVRPGEIPFQVSLYNKKLSYLFCGGSLISAHHILTAAHCVYGRNAADIIAVAGTVNRLTTRLEMNSRQIKTILVHANYNFPQSCYNDIALLKMTAPYLNTSEVGYAYLSISPLISPTEGKIFGYGHLTAFGPAFSELIKAKIHLMDWTTCKRMYEKILYDISETQICIHDSFTTPTKNLFIDSGGPLVVRNKFLFGIESCAPGLQNTFSFPQVFTRISSYLGWIDSQINLDM